MPWSRFTRANSVGSSEITDASIAAVDIASGVGNFGAWSTYTPTLTASSSNPNLGTSPTQSGRYIQIGKLVIVSVRIIFGTGVSVAAGTGTYFVSLPVTQSSSILSNVMGNAIVYRSSGGTTWQCAPFWSGGDGKMLFYYGAGAGIGTVGAAAPWTWAASDQINAMMVYEAA